MEERFLGKVFILTLIYFFVELIGGVYYNSLALLTDSLFMMVNILGQFLTILIHHISRKPADNVMTFGYERVQVLSALVNGFMVGVMIFYVWLESYKKFLHPEPIQELNVLVIAILGLFVN
jgi:cobalt-zinc-cadmium efflux system protein